MILQRLTWPSRHRLIQVKICTSTQIYIGLDLFAEMFFFHLTLLEENPWSGFLSIFAFSSAFEPWGFEEKHRTVRGIKRFIWASGEIDINLNWLFKLTASNILYFFAVSCYNFVSSTSFSRVFTKLSSSRDSNIGHKSDATSAQPQKIFP